MIQKIAISIVLICVCALSQAQVSTIITIAGNGTEGYGGDNGPATAAEFDHAGTLALYDGSLYTADAFNNRVRKIDLTTGITTTVAGNGTGGYNGDNIPATDAELLIPDAECIDTLGNIYIGDALNYRLRRVAKNTGLITTVAGTGVVGNTGDGGPATDAKIGTIAGLSIDQYGNLYMTDVLNNVVRKITPSGIISTIAGNGTSGYSGDNGPAIDAELQVPGKAVADKFGNIIISDNRNHAVRKIDGSTGIIRTIAGNGVAGYVGDGGPASSSQMRYPFGVFIDKDNNIFIVESGNGVVRKIDGATGLINTVVGCGILGFAGDGGPATAAQMRPDDICIDSFGTMYITDYQNNRIRKVYNPQLAMPNLSNAIGEVKIYPNPAKEELSVKYILLNKEDAEMQIVDVMGRVVISKQLPFEKQKETTIDISQLPPGVYAYKVVQGNLLLTFGKVVKE